MNNINKKQYINPQIELIVLDNEISLALESNLEPPLGPDESRNSAPEYFNNNPFTDGKA